MCTSAIFGARAAIPSSDPKMYFCPRFDAIGHRLYAAMTPKIAEVRIRIRFWCMLMLGLGPTWLRLSHHHNPSLAPARASDYCCHPRIDCLLYSKSKKQGKLVMLKLAIAGNRQSCCYTRLQLRQHVSDSELDACHVNDIVNMKIEDHRVDLIPPLSQEAIRRLVDVQ